ncbi:LarC family nickel insertion protein [Catenovulum sp. 2E275]|uniref:LarC family nickel insertion protein n=1 Tax=Catenovulum sp. 2E275 TaxID=2980497 RepID=UPI0021CFC07F|nr:LarC family nickel insertion protein [Catenovulum sp. 2E275]MCU4674189.1 LarC family nickel insertion protein [Catenovulum sp. 2E275]
MKLNKVDLLHLDVAGGIAGDMFIAACLDAFPELADGVKHMAEHLLPQSAGTITFFRDVNAGISCQRVELKSATEQDNHHSCDHANEVHQHNHGHTHDHSHEHSHQHSHSHKHEHSAETTYIALKNKIETSGIRNNVIQIAVDILTILAKAEAKIHATDINQVHFHELADWDSLFDVVGAAYIIDALNQAKWSISSLPLGGGLVKTQHGLIPVPAPATAEILKGFEFRDDGIQGERITPTGAAILKYLQLNKLLLDKPKRQLIQTGYGGGSKRFANMPNILRVMAYQTEQVSCDSLTEYEQVIQLSFDVDDMTQEELAWATDKLRAESDLIDLSVNSARGKKNRLVEQVNILLKETHLDSVIKDCFRYTSTIGVRWQKLNRLCLLRSQHSVLLDDDAYSVKQVMRPALDNSSYPTNKVESDDLASCKTLAQRRKLKQQIE